VHSLLSGPGGVVAVQQQGARHKYDAGWAHGAPPEVRGRKKPVCAFYHQGGIQTRDGGSHAEVVPPQPIRNYRPEHRCARAEQ
jgi:hypothetical protein